MTDIEHTIQMNVQYCKFKISKEKILFAELIPTFVILNSMDDGT